MIASKGNNAMDALKQLTSWLFPTRCLLCRQPHHDQTALCPTCLGDLPFFMPEEGGNLLCRPDVKSLIKQPMFDTLSALAWYRPPFSEWLSGYKFHNQALFGVAIRQVINYQLSRMRAAEDWCDPDIVCILPLHRRRLIWRGFNQVEQTWGKCLPSDLQTKELLVRRKATKAQSALNANGRRHNVKNAFSASVAVRGKSVALIDDVVTTGASLNAASIALKEAGARTVMAWATCITPVD